MRRYESWGKLREEISRADERLAEQRKSKGEEEKKEGTEKYLCALNNVKR